MTRMTEGLEILECIPTAASARENVIDIGCRSMAQAAQGFPVEHHVPKLAPSGTVALLVR
jgi:hypothetical protein